MSTEYLNYLNDNLDVAAEMLGISKDSLYVWMGGTSCMEPYVNSKKLMDKAISQKGFNGGVPVIEAGLHSSIYSACIGLTLYECQFAPDIHYVIFRIQDDGFTNRYFIIVPKNKLARLKRYTQKVRKMAFSKEKPLLEDGRLEEIVENSIGFLLRKREIEEYGVKVKRGILLSGLPGNGKTMVCRYLTNVCTQNNIDYGTVTASEIKKSFYDGHGLDYLFSKWTVTFFDDIDISYLDRSRGNGEVACTILTAMDGVEQKNHLIRIFTTNEEISSLDAAFVRPGRIDRCFLITPPAADLRKRFILEHWHKEIVDYLKINHLVDKLVNQTEDFSFADMDAVKSSLVMNKLLNDKWDLTKAMDDYHEGRDGIVVKKQKKAGFAA